MDPRPRRMVRAQHAGALGLAESRFQMQLGAEAGAGVGRQALREQRQRLDAGLDGYVLSNIVVSTVEG